jgi:hypothetical protein
MVSTSLWLPIYNLSLELTLDLASFLKLNSGQDLGLAGTLFKQDLTITIIFKMDALALNRTIQ